MPDPLSSRSLMKEPGTESVESTPEGVFEQHIDQLQGPIEGFRDDFVVMYKTAGPENRQKMEELLTTYEQNVGAFFGKLFGHDDFSDIKITLTARDVWNKALKNWNEEDVQFVWEKIISSPRLQQILPEQVKTKISAPDFERNAQNLLRLINTISSPDRPEEVVFFQRIFHEGIDPLAAIGGYYKKDFQERFPDVADLLLAETKSAHHKGAGALAFEASRLAATTKEYAEMTPQEQVALLWTNTAVITELYGSETASTTPAEKWDEQVQPFSQLMDRLLTEDSDTATENALRELVEQKGLGFKAFRQHMRNLLDTGSLSLDSRALYDACIKMEQLKPGEVVADPQHPLEGLFYADTEQYPYVTMAFQGERIGIQRNSKEGGRFGHGETSMSLPPEITDELFAQFPFLDKTLKVNLRGEGMDYDVPISGPSASYIYINEGHFFDQPDQVYTYSLGGETRRVKPREILDFLRKKRGELMGD